MFALAGKACVVTGASRGIGRAIVETLLDDGATVWIAERVEGVPPRVERVHR